MYHQLSGKFDVNSNVAQSMVFDRAESLQDENPDNLNVTEMKQVKADRNSITQKQSMR